MIVGNGCNRFRLRVVQDLNERQTSGNSSCSDESVACQQSTAEHTTEAGGWGGDGRDGWQERGHMRFMQVVEYSASCFLAGLLAIVALAAVVIL